MPENEDSHPAKDDHILYIKQKVTEEVLDKSRDVYHNLLPETSLPVNEEHLDHLLKIIWDCNASNKIGIIALHKHKTLPPNHSFVGYAEQAKKGYLYWIMKFANERSISI
ncbi:hypothetical protein FPOA_13448, partial [Fusarium poae]